MENSITITRRITRRTTFVALGDPFPGLKNDIVILISLYTRSAGAT